MNNSFVSLSLTGEDVIELHRSLIMRYEMEQMLRYEQGLEHVDPPVLLQQVESLLQLTDEQSHKIFHMVQEELWNYCWSSYTEEWAWHRAKQDVLTELKTTKKTLTDKELETLIEDMYEKNFERYTDEIDMKDEEKKKKTEKKKAKATKK